MTRYTPPWLQQGSYAASVDRRALALMWPAPYVSGCAVSVSSGMVLNVASGTVAVPTSNSTGTAVCPSDAVEQVTLAAAPGSGSNRYDVVICQLRGNDIDGGANNDFLFTSVTGVAAATPTVPATPANAVALAQVYIPGGSASVTAGNIADVRVSPEPGRRLAYAERTTSPPSQSAEQVVLTTPPVYLPAGKLVRVEAVWWNSTGDAAGSTAARIREGTTTAGLSLVGNVLNITTSGAQVGTGNGGSLIYSYAPSGLPGVKQWVLTCASTTGNPGIIQGGAGIPIHLGVYDVGP